MSKIALLYPGQGSQYCGMGKDFYDEYEEIRDLYKKASEVLGYSIEELCFTDNTELNQTEYTQPAMVLTELAMTGVVKKTLDKQGLCVSAAAGLSLGEYAAISEAGVLDVLKAVELVGIRGRLMSECVPGGTGAMAAVLGLERAALDEAIKEIDGVYLANDNCPGQLVITGYKEAVEKAAQQCSEKGAKRTVMLNVSGPFHSPLLEPAGDSLYEVLKDIEFNAPVHPYYKNVDTCSQTESEGIADSLRRQVSSSVLWRESIIRMLEDGIDVFIEVGPGKTLSGFVKKTIKEYEKKAQIKLEGISIINVDKLEDIEKIKALTV